MKMIRKILAIVLAIMALYLIVLGGRLVSPGGSYYYVIIGLVYLWDEVWAWRNDVRAVWVAGAAFLATLLWALYESGPDYWALFPRVLVPLAIFCAAMFLFASRSTRQGRWMLGGGAVALIAVVVFFGRAFIMVPTIA